MFGKCSLKIDTARCIIYKVQVFFFGAIDDLQNISISRDICLQLGGVTKKWVTAKNKYDLELELTKLKWSKFPFDYSINIFLHKLVDGTILIRKYDWVVVRDY